ncbi:MAG: prevent-host-death protein [Deltaproteobacteria bacterium]|nr:prevent-host-death protein [Deltaproteobacteria bacterium]
MNTIAAQEIKRRGISAVDEKLGKGPVHVIKNNEPMYVVLSEERYQELVKAEDNAYVAGVRESLEDYKAGRIKKGSAQDLIKELGLHK